MKPDQSSEILFAEVLGNGMVVTFVDGTGALYYAELLHEILPRAQRLSEPEVTIN